MLGSGASKATWTKWGLQGAGGVLVFATFIGWKEGFTQRWVDLGAGLAFLLLVGAGVVEIRARDAAAPKEKPSSAGLLVEKPQWRLTLPKAWGLEERRLLLLVLSFACLATLRFDAPNWLKATVIAPMLLLTFVNKTVDARRSGDEAAAKRAVPPKPPKDWWKSL